MPQVTVSVRMKMMLNEIRDEEGHTSVDSVIRTLLVGNGYKIQNNDETIFDIPKTKTEFNEFVVALAKRAKLTDDVVDALSSEFR